MLRSVSENPSPRHTYITPCGVLTSLYNKHPKRIQDEKKKKTELSYVMPNVWFVCPFFFIFYSRIQLEFSFPIHLYRMP